ncbi:hypothetical protein EDD36DRAFT_447593 [Exophiala viscosa]|uniref:Uncharacterized protein n=1 Tax=Exophiala viscosa TaxID=2486360 RepID=A0AAN6DNC1_9EURO|nr:hypothetical protein EDD36DRAFT_447593 [Exophiala viscosa]
MPIALTVSSMAEPANDTLLPAFGIRALNGPQAPPAVVQVTSTQYDSTVKSQPDATLSYVDDDDGEIITVGSSFELGQRLDEPVKHSNLYAIPALRVPNDSTPNRMMHIFDIKHTNATLAEWREHEAYTSKQLQDRGLSQANPDTPKQVPAGMPLFNAVTEFKSGPSPLDPVPSQSVSISSGSIVSSQSHSAPATAETCTTAYSPPTNGQYGPAGVDKIFADMFGGIESKLGPLADFLESTAEGLRNIADKTAKSDHTAVEDVLGGFKDILIQVGGFGLDVAAAIGEGIQRVQDERQISLAQPTTHAARDLPLQRSSVVALKPEKPAVPPTVETAPKRVDFAPPPPPIQPETKSVQRQLRLDQNVDPNHKSPAEYFRAKAAAQCRRQLEEVRRSHVEQPSASSAKHSILDMESNDPDFSARYPPLLGLRKAKSVMELQHKAPEVHKENTGPATMRYPTLREFERDAWAETMQKRLSNITAINNETANKIADLASITDTAHQVKQSFAYQQPTVEDEVDAKQAAKKVSPGSLETNRKEPSTTLPGAWPESRFEASTAALPITRVITDRKPAPTTPAGKASMPERSPDLPSHRMSPPSSDAYPRAPIFPRRNQTVSGTNPAARLNGPFDPLAHIPALQPRPQRSQPDLNAANTAPANALNHKPSLPAVLPNRSRTVNYTDRYIPKYVSPETFAKHPWTHMKNEAKIGRDDGRHMPGPGYGVRYFAPYPYNLRTHGNPVQLASNDQRKATASTAATPANASSSSSSEHIPVFWERSADGVLSYRTGNNPTLTALPRNQPSSEALVAPLAATTQPPRPQPSAYAVSHYHTAASARGRSRAHPKAPANCAAIDECVKTLKLMGFGANPNDMARLNAVAGAAAGNLEDAIDMLEEDREASERLQSGSDEEGRSSKPHSD